MDDKDLITASMKQLLRKVYHGVPPSDDDIAFADALLKALDHGAAEIKISYAHLPPRG